MSELVLAFEEYPDDEIVTRLSPVSVNQYYAVVDAYGTGKWETREAIRAMYATFAPVLVRWTFEPPATADGLGEIDAQLSFALVRRWLEGVREAPIPLPVRSSASTPSEDPSPAPSSEPSGSATS